MGFHRHKTLSRMGLPEVVVITLLSMTLLPTYLWWISGTPWTWITTDGEVVHGSLQTVHANAQDYPSKVTVIYKYKVGALVLSSKWEGFWPLANSPNALPPSGLNVLKQKGHRLTVLYNPNDPQISRLHYLGQDQQMFYAMLTVFFMTISVLYCLRVYPVWRNY